MAHELYMKGNKASMMYVGEVPWHSLGTRLEKPATSEEAIEAAGLDYQVVKRPLYTPEDVSHNPIFHCVPRHYATVRTDTNEPLGVVGTRYTPIQNKDAFHFFDALVGEGEAIYHTAGALGSGERIWILAKLPGYIKVGKEDIVDKFLLLTNSHDGSSLVRAKLTPIRVVCNNTLSAALAGPEPEVRIRHTGSAQLYLHEAHRVLNLSNHLYEQLDGIFNTMNAHRLSSDDLKKYVETLIPDNPSAEENFRTERIREKIYELHETGRGAELCRGSVWGAYNAITEYTDHVVSSHDKNKALKSMWFGGGEALKHKAFALAKEMCN